MNPTPLSRYQRLLTLVVALVLGGAVMGWVALGMVKERLVATTGEALALAAVGMAEKLDGMLAERHGDIRVLAGVARRLLGSAPALGDHLTQVRAAFPLYQWLAVTDADGRVIAAGGDVSPGADQRGTEWFAAARSGTGVFVREGFAPQETGGAPVVVFAMSMRDEAGQFLGAVAAAASLSRMELASPARLPAFASVRRAGGDLEWQILTRAGRVFYDSRDGLQQQHMVEAGLPSATALGRGESGWTEERHARRAVPVITGYAPTRGRGEFRGLGCGVLVRLERAEVLAVVNRVLWRVGLAGGAGLLPLAALLWWSVGRLRQDWRRVVASEGALRAARAELEVRGAGRTAELARANTALQGEVTAHERSEAALRESEASFQLLVATIPGMVWTAWPDGTVEWVSQRAVDYIGRPLGELVGVGWAQFIHPEDLPNTLRIMERSLATGDPFESEYRLLGGDGVFRWHIVRARALREPDGRMTKWFGTTMDITDRKRVEAALATARDAALAADRLKSAFLATMSHELRTPLNSIIGFTGTLLLKLAGPLNPEQNKQLEMVRTSARHLLALINDVLDLSKIEAGQLEVSCERFDLRAAITRVADSVRPLAEKKGLSLQVAVSAAVDGMHNDQRRVEQVLLNLLSNAIKFTERGGVTLRAEAASLPASARPAVRLAVTDTGMGIKAEDLVHLFQPFRQLDSGLTRSYEGTGLGLAICQRLATRLGGTIQVQSEWGRGSIFTFTLPLAPVASAGSEQP